MAKINLFALLVLALCAAGCRTSEDAEPQPVLDATVRDKPETATAKPAVGPRRVRLMADYRQPPVSVAFDEPFGLEIPIINTGARGQGIQITLKGDAVEDGALEVAWVQVGSPDSPRQIPMTVALDTDRKVRGRVLGSDSEKGGWLAVMFPDFEIAAAPSRDESQDDAPSPGNVFPVRLRAVLRFRPNTANQFKMEARAMGESESTCRAQVTLHVGD